MHFFALKRCVIWNPFSSYNLVSEVHEDVTFQAYYMLPITVDIAILFSALDIDISP